MTNSAILRIVNAMNMVELGGFTNEEEESVEDAYEVQLKAEIEELKRKLEAEKKLVAELDAEIAAEDASIAETEHRKAVVDHCEYRRRMASIPLHENDYKRVESIQRRALTLQAALGLTFEFFGVRSGVLRGYVKNSAGRLEYFSINVKDLNDNTRETLWSLIQS